MPAYDAKQFDPPAPIASVVIRSRQSGVTFSNVMMLLDSGADITLLPQTAVEQLGVLPIPEQRYELVGFDGTTSSAQVAELEMVFLNRTFRGRFLLIGDEMGILGRDVLNHVSLLFNGPGLTWSERQSKKV